jgi:hypothetical protein
MYEGISTEHILPKTTRVYFEPIELKTKNDEYLSSIHITHQGDIPATSTVKYGVNMNGSLNPSEFANLYQDWIKPDEYSIILSRANELLRTDNYLKYYATSGAWTSDATVEIRRFTAEKPTGEVIFASEYVLNASEGTVSFYLPLNKAAFFTITILFNSSFRLLCKIENTNGDAATIDHIAVMYSVMKRFNADPQGNIIRRPWAKRT